MSKKADFKHEVVKGAEMITITAVLRDRIIFDPIKVVPANTSTILDQDGKPMETSLWDRWPIRGKVVYAGDEVKDVCESITEGSFVFIEDARACSRIDINGAPLAMTRISNILLVYDEK